MDLSQAIIFSEDTVTIKNIGESKSAIMSFEITLDDLKTKGPELIKGFKKLAKDRILAPAFVEALSQAHQKVTGE